MFCQPILRKKLTKNVGEHSAFIQYLKHLLTIRVVQYIIIFIYLFYILAMMYLKLISIDLIKIGKISHFLSGKRHYWFRLSTFLLIDCIMFSLNVIVICSNYHSKRTIALMSKTKRIRDPVDSKCSLVMGHIYCNFTQLQFNLMTRRLLNSFLWYL